MSSTFPLFTPLTGARLADWTARVFTPLTGSSVVVTGGSKGIGRGIAAAFAGAGARVLLAARDEATLAVTAEELRAAGGDVTHVAVDVSRPEGCAAMAAAAVDRFGGIGHAALFLATAEAGYITGQTLVVDGGQVLPESLDALP